MKSYLIDFENVKSKGLEGIEQLEETDRVVIFFSENSDTITFDMHYNIMRAKAKIEYTKVRVGGKNALDFQLATLLGFMVADEKNTHIYIISNDKGFDRLHDFWNDTYKDSTSCIVYRTQNILSALDHAKKYEQKNPSEVKPEAVPAAAPAEEPVSEVPAQPEETPAEKTPAEEAAAVQPSEESAEQPAGAEPVIEETSPAEAVDFEIPEQLIEEIKQAEIKAEQQPETETPVPESKPKKVDTKMKKLLHQLLDEKASNDEFSGVVAVINQSADESSLKINLSQRFGKQRGKQIFGFVKTDYLEFIGAAESQKPAAKKKKKAAAKPKPSDSLKEILLSIISEAEYPQAAKVIDSANNNQELYRGMIKCFKMQRGLSVYNGIKKEFSKLKSAEKV